MPTMISTNRRRKSKGTTTTRRTSSVRVEMPQFDTMPLPHPNEARATALAWAQMSQKLAISYIDGSLLIWSPVGSRSGGSRASELRVQVHEGSNECCAWNPSEDVLASGGEDAIVYLLDSKGKTIEKLVQHERKVTAVAFSSTGKLLVSSSTDTTIRVWNLLSMEVAYLLEGHQTAVLNAVFSHDDAFLLSRSVESKAKLWNMATGTLQCDLTAHDQRMTSACFAPGNSKLCATASLDCTTRLWEDGVEQAVFEDHSSDVNQVAFSPNGRQLCSCSADGTACLYKVSTRELTLRLTGVAPITAITYSHDGSVLAAVDELGQLGLWASGNGELLASEHRHKAAISHIKFSPKGDMIATVDADGVALVWFLGPRRSSQGNGDLGKDSAKCIIS